MRVTEIYASVQGETQYAGLPCTLVRTTGCDLRCGYCDTTYSFYGGRDMGLDERRYHPRQVAGLINRAKNEAVGPDDFDARDGFERTVQSIYAAYEGRMRDSGALDFGDLIYRLVDAMAKLGESIASLP